MFKNNCFNPLKAVDFALFTVIIILIVRHYSQLLDYSYLNNKFESIHSDSFSMVTLIPSVAQY